MQRLLTILLGCLVAEAALGQIAVNEAIPQVATLDVFAAKPIGPPIPRTIFGTFLEPIGNSTYNGLWAELLENPSMESGLWSPANVARMLRDRPELHASSDVAIPLPWEPLNPAQGNRYEVRRGDAANSWQSLRVFAVPGEPTGIKQRVYLPIHRTRGYVGSFYARHIDGDTKITVELRSLEDAAPLAAQEIDAGATEWRRYEFKLTVPEEKLHRLDPADFVVQLAGDERVDLDEFSLMPADALNGLDPDEVALAKAMNTPLVRFGGNYTSSYRWMDGVGPRDKRISKINIAWGIPEYNTFGTDEFLEFCRQIGAEPQIALNLGSGTRGEAADWVRYVDEHWITHSGLLWELGNELWGNWNLAYPTQGQLAQRTAEFSKAVRAVDPGARLIATGADPDGFKSWNATELTNPPGTFDFLSTHFVVNTGEVQLRNPTPDFVAQAAFALPVELERRLHEAQEQIDGTPGYNGKVHIAFTEWLFVGERNNAPQFTNAGGAMVTAGFLNMLLRNADVVPISDMTGIMEFAGIWKKRSQVYATPAYYVFKLYANADVARRVETTARAGSYSVAHGVRRLPEIASVPYLDVVAALNQEGRRLTLFCVNRSLNTDIATSIRIHDFVPTSQAAVETLRFDSLADSNDEVEPDRLQPSESKEPARMEGWMHTFPHSSVTVLILDRR
jgi:alpha-L-arabinofuranosidase